MKQILGIILSFFSGIWGPTTAAPPLTEKQIALVLVDMELAEAVVSDYTKDEQAAAELLQANRHLICKAHNIELEAFQRSYEYYAKDLQVLKSIYEDVISQLKTLNEKASE